MKEPIIGGLEGPIEYGGRKFPTGFRGETPAADGGWIPQKLNIFVNLSTGTKKYSKLHSAIT